MQKENQKTDGLGFVILGIVMAVVSVFIFYLIFVWDILPGACFFLNFITIPLVVNGIAYLIYYLTAKIKGKEQIFILPLTSLTVAILSAVIGGILYANDHGFIMRGIEAEFVWFFVSAPSLVLSIIHFVITYIQMGRKVKAIEE